jgi:NhaA family Na+:H+ antiporter
MADPHPLAQPVPAAPQTPEGHGEGEHGMFERFLHSQVASSGVLVLFALLALILANSPWAAQYTALAKTQIGVSFGEHLYSHTLSHWIKDGLMAIFFFVVGLEIKRELVVGELSSVRRAMLPVSAACGGALVPALIYAWFNWAGPAAAGWGIPMATDIAFALGVLSLFGRRVPIGLKVFLTALAIADDLLAVVVIAVFYTSTINVAALISAGLFLGLVYAASRARVRSTPVYLVLALGVWVSMEACGIHATIAGVLIALLIPVHSLIEPEEFMGTAREHLDRLEGCRPTRESLNRNEAQRAAVSRIYLAAADMIPPGIALEKQLHAVQAFLILPLFALFAAGVRLDPSTLSHFPGPAGLGIVLGLVVGKQVGIMAASLIAVYSGVASLPAGVGWSRLWATSVLAGIGFTMSIFIGDLAFADESLIAEAKIAVLIASVLAGLLGAALLHLFLPRQPTAAEGPAPGH